jgi:4-amino-4-deoxy-L-arabinose transferase-like glycosyltransferase
VTSALPYDGWSLAAIAVASACLAAASRRSLTTTTRLGLIAAAAFVLRLDPAWQYSLHVWDESVHAVVARHLAVHPLTPTLYDPPLLPVPDDNWTEAHVWLHKPPLALWLMAASLSIFGISPLAMRLPSLLLGTLGVLLTYLTGRRLFGARAGLLAAAFQAVSGLLIALSSGRRVADHVDTALITCVQLSIWLAVTATGDAGARRRLLRAGLAGAAMGAAILAKSFPALIALIVAAVVWASADGAARAMKKIALFAAAAACVAAPWLISIRLRFPVEAREADAYTLRHITEVLEGHAGSAWSYLLAMPHYFGELIYVPVVAFLIGACRRDSSAGARAVAIWVVVPYAVFSSMATKLPGFVAIAAPALFLAQAQVWVAWRDRVPSMTRRPARWALAALLVLLACLPARYLLEPAGALERRDRFPAMTRQFMALDRLIGAPIAVIYGVPHPFELMFYSRHLAFERPPRADEIETLRRQRVPVFVYQDGELRER